MGKAGYHTKILYLGSKIEVVGMDILGFIQE